MSGEDEVEEDFYFRRAIKCGSWLLDMPTKWNGNGRPVGIDGFEWVTQMALRLIEIARLVNWMIKGGAKRGLRGYVFKDR